MKKNNLILGVTSCTMGVAHTFMAASAIEKECKRRGYDVKIEKQGGTGIKDKITNEDIENASLIIIACDLPVREKERFSKLPKIVAKSSSFAIKSPEKLLDEVDEKIIKLNKKIKISYKINNQNAIEEKNKIKFPTIDKNFFLGGFLNFKKAFFTGISYMIPVVVAGGMILAIVAAIQGTSDVAKNSKILTDFSNWSIFLMQYFPTILSMFIAFAYADKPGIAPGFAAGIIMFQKFPSTSFLGGIVAGVVAGYITKAVMFLIRPNETMRGFVAIMIWPLVSVALVGISIYFAFGYPAYYMSEGIKEFLIVLKKANLASLAAFFIAGFAMIDCGGVFSKSSFAAVLLVIEENPEYWVAYASGIFGVSLGLLISTLTHKKYYTKEGIAAGRTAFIPAAVGGISEGSLGALFSDIKTVPISYFIGAGSAGALAVALNITGPIVPAGGIVLPFLLNPWHGSIFYTILLYYACNLFGALVCYICLTSFKWILFRKPLLNGWVNKGVITYPKDYNTLSRKLLNAFKQKEKNAKIK